MGSTCFIIVADETPGLLDSLREYVNKLESLWSRFQPKSELMLANNAHGDATTVSPETISLIQEMKFGYQLTSGIFDPTQLHKTLEFGFSQSKFNDKNETLLSDTEHDGLCVLDVEIDVQKNRIRIPSGLAIDAGGIGKGFAADLTADLAIKLGAQGVAVFIGGEVRVRGDAQSDDGWTVGVSHPHSSAEFVDVLAIHDGGVATSGPMGWRNHAGESHILNPRTHKPVLSDVLQATVIASTSAHAEVLTKLCIVLDIQEALSEVERIGVEALLIDTKLNRFETPGWEKFTKWIQ